MSYQSPRRDLQFVLFELLEVPSVLATFGEGEILDESTLQQVIDAAAAFASDVVQPLNRVADREGCALERGQVTTPRGFVQAYDEFRAQGWPSLCGEEGHGGQGLPQVAFSVLQEHLGAACHAFSMLAGINHCAWECVRHAASPELVAEWLPRLLDGSVLSTMSMTEPQAGSDLGLARTKAQPTADGSFAVTGGKVFVSGGDHDLTANIVHLVLARLPDAPSGSGGLSLFLVPKRLADGSSNHVYCDGIEHKLGLHGNPTCVLRFESSRGSLVGEPHRGLAALFFMMNAARLLCGLQAIGLSEAAYQQALSYAADRKQGRLPGATPDDAPVSIARHPDVQRMLMVQKAYVEGGRALVHWAALEVDRSQRHGDPDIRSEARELLGLLTPIIKGFLCENAQACVSLALQIHGGHGYVSETGIDQYVRDSRVLTIYEGTTSIQAIDLVVRKIQRRPAETIDRLLSLIDAAVGEGSRGPTNDVLDELVGRLRSLRQTVRETLMLICDRGRNDGDFPLRAASNTLRILGHAVLASMWVRMAATATRGLIKGNDPFYRSKLLTATFYFQHLLPEVDHLVQTVRGDHGPLDAAFT